MFAVVDAPARRIGREYKGRRTIVSPEPEHGFLLKCKGFSFSGYAAYAGLLAIESCHTNPVLVTFTKLLWLSQSIRYQAQRSQDESTSDHTGKTNSFRLGLAIPSPSVVGHQRRSTSTRSKTVRNRWHLYVTLHHNPGLRLLRKEAIRVDRLMHAEEVILDDALIEAPRLRLLLRRISERKDLI